MKKSGRLVLTLAVSALFLLAVLWNVDVRQTKEALKTANYAYVPLAVLLSLVTNILRSYRWKYVLNPIRPIGILSLFSGVAVGYMANNVLPARLGEVVRSYFLGKKEGLSTSSTLATIVIERLFDGFTLLLFLTLISLLFTFPDWIKKVGWVAAAILVAFSVFLAFLVVKKNVTLELVRRSTAWVPAHVADRVHGLAGSFLTGLAILNHRRDTLLAFAFSVLAWTVEAGTYYVVSLCFGFHLPIYVAIVTVVIVNFGILLPAAPGYIGTFEFFCISALDLASVEKSVALSYAVVLHVVLVVPITVIGMMYFVKDHVSLGVATTLMPEDRDRRVIARHEGANP
jgi:uncharacterized protein (TIRG00374 family)